MNKTRIAFLILVTGLIGLGSGLCIYRYINFDVSLLPGEKREIWSVEARVEFEAQGDPVKVSLAIPDTQEGFERIAEHSASPGYGLAYVDRDLSRRAEWSIREATGRQLLYYRVDMIRDEFLNQSGTVTIPAISQPRLGGTGPHKTEALSILNQANQKSADAYTLTRQLIYELNTQTQSRQLLTQKQALSTWVVELLAQANVAAREVHVVELEDGRRRQKLKTYVQVFQGNRYVLFDLESGAQLSHKNRLLWEYNSKAILEVVGGYGASASFSILKQEIPINQIQKISQLENKSLLDFSIHSLPVEEQTLFKGILLIPIGILIVVFMRLFIGIRTSGTFMPVLIAIAFIQTSLVTGLIGFFLVVGTGLIIRGYLSQHNLLLVARISVIIVSVIILISLFTVASYRAGLTEGLKITFFPMIILSWTIERMSILWEEEGPHEVFVQTGGSLFIAVIAYFLMLNDVVQHLMFNFIGLQFLAMALLLIMGSYKGYRLLEFHRFMPLTRSLKAPEKS